MTTIVDMFPSRFLRAMDIPQEGLELKIESVDLVALYTGDKHVVTFEGLQKGLVLNVTNARALFRLCGPNTLAWPGTRIVLYQALAAYKGDEVPAIRVRAPGRTTQGQQLPS